MPSRIPRIERNARKNIAPEKPWKPYSESEVKTIKVGEREFHVPVKRVQGHSGNDHLLILGVIGKQDKTIKPTPRSLHEQIVTAVRKQFTGIKEERVHVLNDKDRSTKQLLDKLFTQKEPPTEITKSQLVQELREIRITSELKQNEKVKPFLAKIKGKRSENKIQHSDVRKFYNTLLTEILEKAVKQKQEESKKPTTKPPEKTIKEAAEEKTEAKEEKIQKVKYEYKKDSDKDKSNMEQIAKQGVNINVENEAGGRGMGFGMYPPFYNPNQGKQEEEKKKDDLLKPRPVNVTAFAILIVIIIIILGIIFS